MTNMDDQKSVKATLEIRRNSDGQVRASKEPWDYYGDFIWSEGNFSCDCNRYLFWCRAGDDSEDEDDEDAGRCGDERFSVRLKDEAGNVLYEDFDRPTVADA